MTFWDFFNGNPISGLIVSVSAIVGVWATATNVIDGIASTLKVKWGGCDCVPCDLEHVEEDGADQVSGVAEKKT